MAKRVAVWPMELRDLGEHGYRLKEPILILIEEYDVEVRPQYVASWPEVKAYGLGDRLDQALDDLRAGIIDAFESPLIADRDKLSEFLRSAIRVMESVIEPVDDAADGDYIKYDPSTDVLSIGEPVDDVTDGDA